MRNSIAVIGITLSIGPFAFAQAPVITAVLDAAAYTPNIAQGQVFVVKGNNLATSSVSATLPYPNSVGGVSINFTPAAGGAAIPANMIYTYSSGGITQLAALLPTPTPTGNYNVTVVAPGGTSAPFPVTVVSQKFGLLTVNSAGTGRALVQNVVTSSQYDLNRFTTGSSNGYTYSPGKPGQTLIAYGTGLNSATPITVTAIIGGAQISATGVAQGQYPGLDQVNITLPANVPTGCFLQFQISVNGQVSNPTTVSIAPNSSSTACVDPNYSQSILGSLDQPGGSVTIGSFNLEAVSSSLSLGGQTINMLTQTGGGGFAQYTADEITTAPTFTVSATNPCSVFQYTYTVTDQNNPSPFKLNYLDAGTITVNGPNINNQAFTEKNNLYSLSLGAPGSSTPIIANGTYTLTGAGGKDVGAFHASVNVDAILQVTGGLPANVPRSQNLNIAWTPATGSDLVIITGSSSKTLNGTAGKPPYTVSFATFYCTTTTGAGSFIVPSSILSQLPVSDVVSGIGTGSIAVLATTLPNSTSGNGFFTAPLTAGGNINYGLFVVESGAAGLTNYQ